MASVADTAVIAIIAGATTTLGVPVVALWADTRRGGRERGTREVAELRALLDEAALRLEQGQLVVEQIEGEFLTSMEQTSPSYEEHRDTLRQLRGRLAIRLGTRSEVVKTFDDAVSVLDKLNSTMTISLMGGSVGREEAAREILQVAALYEPAVDGFITAAYELAGAVLPNGA